MKSGLLFLSFLAATGCLSFGCATISANRQSDGDFALKLVLSNDDLIVRLINISDHELVSHGLFLSSAKGGAGYYLSISDRAWRRHFQCAMIEQLEPGEGRIPPHGHLEIEIPLDSLKGDYCLQSGVYTVQATFAVPRPSAGPQIVAEAVPISVNIK